MQLSYEFEEIPLSIGADSQGRQQNIALISGRVILDVARAVADDYPAAIYEWDIVDIYLRGPLRGDKNVPLDAHTPLFIWAERSIRRACEHGIYEEIQAAA